MTSRFVLKQLGRFLLGSTVSGCLVWLGFGAKNCFRLIWSINQAETRLKQLKKHLRYNATQLTLSTYCFNFIKSKLEYIKIS